MKRIANGNHPRIPTPKSRYFSVFRRRVLPVAIWALAIAALAPLIKSQYYHVDAVGIAEYKSSSVVPLLDGKIEMIAVDVFERVEKTDVVALLDDSLFQAGVRTAKAELERLRADMDAARENLEFSLAAASRGEELDELNDMRRFQMNEESARLDLLDRITEQEANRVNLVRLEILFKRHQQLILDGATSQDVLDDIKYQKEALAVQIKENENSIALARKNLAETARRRERRAKTAAFTAPTLALSPYLAALKVQEAKIYELMETSKLVILRSPLSGTVASIHYRPGENVTKGSVLMEIDGPATNRVLAYVQEDDIRGIREGAPVKVYTRRKPREVTEAKVLKVGASIEMLPLRLQPNPDLPKWGVSVLVGQAPEGRFFPGELLDLRFPSENRLEFF